jgi:hypothetical protein
VRSSLSYHLVEYFGRFVCSPTTRAQFLRSLVPQSRISRPEPAILYIQVRTNLCKQQWLPIQRSPCHLPHPFSAVTLQPLIKIKSPSPLQALRVIESPSQIQPPRAWPRHRNSPPYLGPSHDPTINHTTPPRPRPPRALPPNHTVPPQPSLSRVVLPSHIPRPCPRLTHASPTSHTTSAHPNPSRGPPTNQIAPPHLPLLPNTPPFAARNPS